MFKKDMPCVNDCGRLVGPSGSKGYCNPCKSKRVRDEYKLNPQPCIVDGCDRNRRGPGPATSHIHCDLHYSRVRRHGEPGPAAPSFVRGEGHVRPDGYRRIARTMEHRLVMERILGRQLLPEENVHHLNGDRLDNRPENLELWSKSQPAGQRVVDKIAWALEFLESYGYEVPAVQLRIA